MKKEKTVQSDDVRSKMKIYAKAVEDNEPVYTDLVSILKPILGYDPSTRNKAETHTILNDYLVYFGLIKPEDTPHPSRKQDITKYKITDCGKAFLRISGIRKDSKLEKVAKRLGYPKP
jgi:hypothetical protein